MKKIYILPIGLTALLIVVGQNVYAYRGNPAEQGPNYTEERHELMQEAFNDNDYNSWKDLMIERGTVRVVEVITEENFKDFARVRSLMLEGRVEDAQELKQELGLGQKNGMGNGRNGGGDRSKDGAGFRRNR